MAKGADTITLRRRRSRWSHGVEAGKEGEEGAKKEAGAGKEGEEETTRSTVEEAGAGARSLEVEGAGARIYKQEGVGARSPDSQGAGASRCAETLPNLEGAPGDLPGASTSIPRRWRRRTVITGSWTPAPSGTSVGDSMSHPRGAPERGRSEGARRSEGAPRSTDMNQGQMREGAAETRSRVF